MLRRWRWPGAATKRRPRVVNSLMTTVRRSRIRVLATWRNTRRTRLHRLLLLLLLLLLLRWRLRTTRSYWTATVTLAVIPVGIRRINMIHRSRRWRQVSIRTHVLLSILIGRILRIPRLTRIRRTLRWQILIPVHRGWRTSLSIFRRITITIAIHSGWSGHGRK